VSTVPNCRATKAAIHTQSSHAAASLALPRSLAFATHRTRISQRQAGSITSPSVSDARQSSPDTRACRDTASWRCIARVALKGVVSPVQSTKYGAGLLLRSRCVRTCSTQPQQLQREERGDSGDSGGTSAPPPPSSRSGAWTSSTAPRAARRPQFAAAPTSRNDCHSYAATLLHLRHRPLTSLHPHSISQRDTKVLREAAREWKERGRLRHNREATGLRSGSPARRAGVDSHHRSTSNKNSNCWCVCVGKAEDK
jgi:hypothetical protein